MFLSMTSLMAITTKAASMGKYKWEYLAKFSSSANVAARYLPTRRKTSSFNCYLLYMIQSETEDKISLVLSAAALNDKENNSIHRHVTIPQEGF